MIEAKLGEKNICIHQDNLNNEKCLRNFPNTSILDILKVILTCI